MTSRSLFFKLMREDLKRRFWAVGLAFLSFFFWMPVNAAMRISDLQQTYERWVANGTIVNGMTPEARFAERLLGIVGATIGLENLLSAATIAVASIVMALTGFMYLHSRKQIDFYHSIPVRRELIFAAKYLNGILIIVSMYLLNMILAMGILAVNGIEVSVLIPTGAIAFVVHVAGYLINYGLMTIAVMLTGNFFISILGGVVLFAYIPAALALILGLMYLFFTTINLRGVSVEQMMVNGSPISYYINVVAEGVGMELGKYGMLMDSVGVMTLVGVVMSVVALFLYKKRPSESAGKSMVFKITKAPIKILLVVPITIAVSVLFWNIYYSVAWAVFGFVIGLLITHCIIEIIYHFEFTKLFSNLHHMGISAVLALAIIAVFRFDLTGYDTYKPSENEFESASIYVSNIRDHQDYGLPYYYESNGMTHSTWRYLSMNDYVIENMKFTDYEIVSKLADAGILESEREKEIRYSNQDYAENPEGFWTALEVGYTLKNGKTIYRNYRVNVTELRDVFDQMYTTAEYKNGTVPVLAYTDDNITGIYETHTSEIREVEADDALRAEILAAYKEEMTALTLEERATVSPITSLRFLTIAEYDYICSISKQNNPNYTGDFRLEDMNTVNFFPVYPSFEKTLGLLAEAGIEDLGPVQVEDVLRIEIIGDYYTDEGARTIALEDDGTSESLADMKSVIDVIVHQELAQLNGLQPMEYGITVRVYMKDANEGMVISNQEFIPYLFPPEDIPQFVKDTFDYDNRESKNINYGLNIPVEK